MFVVDDGDDDGAKQAAGGDEPDVRQTLVAGFDLNRPSPDVDLVADSVKTLLRQSIWLLAASLAGAVGLLWVLYAMTRLSVPPDGGDALAGFGHWLLERPESGTAPVADWTAVAILLVVAPLTLVLAVSVGPRTAYAPGSGMLLPVEVIARARLIEGLTFWVALGASVGLWAFVVHTPRDTEHAPVILALLAATILDITLASLSGPSYEQRLQDRKRLNQELGLLEHAPRLSDAPRRAWRSMWATGIASGLLVGALTLVYLFAFGPETTNPWRMSGVLGLLAMTESWMWSQVTAASTVPKWLSAPRPRDPAPDKSTMLAELRMQRPDAASMFLGVLMLVMMFGIVVSSLGGSGGGGGLVAGLLAIAALFLPWHVGRRLGFHDDVLLRAAAQARLRVQVALERMDRSLVLVDPTSNPESPR